MGEIDHLGLYRITSFLGKGAVWALYEGIGPDSTETVLLKVFRKDLIPQNTEGNFLSDLQRNFKATALLKHPQIVSACEIEVEDGTPYVVMKKVQGETLQHLFDQSHHFSVETSIDIINQLLTILAFSHGEGVVYQGIKPTNVLIQGNGRVMLTGVGLAEVEAELGGKAEAMDAPWCSAPEHFDGNGVDHRTDIFTVGAIFYHLMTGEKPFPGNSITTIKHRILHTAPIKVSDLNYQAPRLMDGVIFMALAKNPEERFQTAAEFLKALAKAASGRSPADSTLGGAEISWHPERIITDVTLQLDNTAQLKAISQGSILDGKGKWLVLAIAAAIVLTGLVCFLALND
ncbi:MAG: serine/threonine protein kinase [Proteobacteria bacterium]|nr:serine/threonine protein kinase [Pseudomonadota bacterium]MBU1686489.1 serine/threonine protein kinase [Pseudomonadota bacterium]